MSTMIFYRERSEYGREVAAYLDDFERQTSKSMEVIDPDSPRGADLCRIYDIVEFPTIITTTDDGQLRYMWRGLPLPLIDQVSYYA